MDDQTQLRYSRHLILDEWGDVAQTRLQQAKVLVIGMGGLGCPAAHWLVTCGVGTVTLCDGDQVDASNVLRQYLHTMDHIGEPKVHSARRALQQLNPLCTIQTVYAKLSGNDLVQQVQQHDIVLDCTDNFASRHAINRACVRASKPLFSGSALRFDGQLIAFNVQNAESPCYHCVFPELGNDQETDRCALTGVFAPLTAQIGTALAAQAIKFIAGVGQVPFGHLQLINALAGTTDRVLTQRDSACPVCSQRSLDS